MLVQPFVSSLKNDHAHGPSTVYIHEKNVPYPYYLPQAPPPRCEIITQDSHKHMLMPHYILPLIVLGAVLLFAILTIGLLLIIEKARLTPVVRARMQSFQQPQQHTTKVEEILAKSIDLYSRLNNEHDSVG
ncbi:hypothetical protein ABEB36_001714 [Hypothenemus hampei]|uniref:Uncharacterized protein n=1 Tax=Hypothenemus hampei TaxID=57062 RepID=A0ABD1FJ07_HYPHA